LHVSAKEGEKIEKKPPQHFRKTESDESMKRSGHHSYSSDLEKSCITGGASRMHFKSPDEKMFKI